MYSSFDLQKEYKGNLKWLADRTIFLSVHGSVAYGTNTPTSDLDIKGICIPPKNYILGFTDHFEQAEQKEPDMVVYDIKKFMKLAAQGNPTVLEVLFTDPEFWIKVTPEGQKLIDNRNLFLSKKVKFTFSGYAFSQLKRLKSHRAWLLNPPTKKPERSDFGLSEISKVSVSAMGAFKSLEEKELIIVDKEIVPLLQKEKAYHNALVGWQQHENWKKNRNPERAEQEAKFGYSGKYALHLVRLIKMAREILSTGEVIVKRPDARELLEIKNGAWTYDQLISWAEEQEKELGILYETSTAIPDSPDMKKLQELCIEIVESMNFKSK
jgi:hypothetical protein